LRLWIQVSIARQYDNNDSPMKLHGMGGGLTLTRKPAPAADTKIIIAQTAVRLP
jgi:hypothetical protein